MGFLRSWLFRIIYPLPQKGDDLLAHKQKFTEEYVSSHQFGTDLESLFVSQKLHQDACYAKKQHDKGQKQRLEAYKTWQKIVYKKERT